MPMGGCEQSLFWNLSKPKGGQRRTVFINKRLAKALEEYLSSKHLHDLSRPLFESQKGGHFSPNTMCQLFLDIYKKLRV